MTKQEMLDMRKRDIEGLGYIADMKTKVKVKASNGSIYDVYHELDDVVNLDHSVEASKVFGQDTIRPAGIGEVPPAIVEEVSDKLKQLNMDLYNYLQDKYTEMDNVDTNLSDEEYLQALKAIVWDYPIDNIINYQPSF